MDKIKDQFHPILDENQALSEIRLGNLFDEYSTNVSQIIRSQNGIYTQLLNRLENNGNLHLFNAVDQVNEQVISSFNTSRGKESNQAIIAEIFGPEGIIIKSSIRVVNVLEMNNITKNQTQDDKLFLDSIPQSKSYDEFIQWFCNKFYRGKFHPDMIQSFFYRNIILDK